MSKSSSKLKAEALKAYLEEQKLIRKKKVTSSIVMDNKYKFKNN